MAANRLPVSVGNDGGELRVRRAGADDVPELEQIVRAAFAAQFNLPSPAAFGDRALLAPRRAADPASVFAAELDGRLVGCVSVSIWGTLGWFGPLAVHPDYWNRKIGQALLVPVLERFSASGTRAQVLFTLPGSPKHVALYQRYGFWPRRLTAILARPAAPAPDVGYGRFSTLGAAERTAALRDARRLTGGLFAGLDVSLEMSAVVEQGLGETLLLTAPRGGVRGFAVVHAGAGSEAGSGVANVKFGAAADAAAFGALLDAASDYAAERGVARVVASVNTAREGAYAAALGRGFTIAMLGVAMVRGGAVYDVPGAWVIEDHR